MKKLITLAVTIPAFFFSGCEFAESPSGKRIAAFGKVAEQVALAAAEKYAEDQLQLWIEENTK